MTKEGDDLSVFTRVEKHDKLLNNHNELIRDQILPRLKAAEQVQVEFGKVQDDIKSDLVSVKTDVAVIRNAQTSMELTVMKDGQQTRETLNKFVNHYFESDEKAFRSRGKVEITKLSGQQKVKLALIAVFAGGGLAVIGDVVITIIKTI